MNESRLSDYLEHIYQAAVDAVILLMDWISTIFWQISEPNKLES
ncbi:hypothetical protein ACW4YW_05460 [Methylobacillus pratensis]